jgi:hypothetical protein
VVEATPAMALSALAPSTILQRRPPERNMLSALAHLVERVPAFTLELGTEISSIPAAIRALLR